ncbi:MAG: hypothetical protein HOP29_14040 [Phycisphaerales bacterium]|nr:hypothetical protein [Phycisphaerales bacterium]
MTLHESAMFAVVSTLASFIHPQAVGLDTTYQTRTGCTGSGGGPYDAVATVHHEARHDNRLAWLTTGDGASPPSQTSTPTPHDPNGNLTRDGAYVYQYDAFNRLIEVRTPSQPGGGGDVSLISLLYDGLGRLAATTHDTVSPSRKTWLFHDGVRRIAEWAAEWDKNEEAFVATATEREYVYGPDYVDEHVAQIVPGNPDATPYPIPDKVVYTLQDANYNVVALLDDAGNVLRQYTWSPYGQLTASERCTPGPGGQGLAPHPANRIGHQGLFWISFGADSIDPNGDLSDDLFPPLPSSYFRPDLNGLYYSRARFYSPHLGRFLTPDPNETATPLLTVAYMNGQTAMTSLGLFNAEALYADGMNLYTGYGSNPLSNHDGLGLSYNPYDDWIDETIGEYYGERAAMAGRVGAAIGFGIQAAQVLGYAALSFLPGGQAVLLGIKIASGDFQLSDLLTLIPGGAMARLSGAGGIGYSLFAGYNKAQAAYNKASRAIRVTGAALARLRQEFNRLKGAFWRYEAQTKSGSYSAQQLERMRQGKAPLGADGHPMEVHHKTPLSQGGSNSFDNLQPMTKTQHRLEGNYGPNHPPP